ncbi:MAG: phospholipase [Bacteroidia bacterium]|jgi:predicted esterase|nr:phospholipase [Bacteroidia bacterium]
MKKHVLKVAKTARYFTLGNSGSEVREVWFVCHGYAQLASEFLQQFATLQQPGRLLVAPEGLHRFYRKGGRGEVAASWMTSEDRQHDIEEYVAALNATAEEVLHTLPQNVRIIVLGFSQGAATVCRWLQNGKIKADELVLWCGFFPPDMKPPVLPLHTKLTLLTASHDRFISPEENEAQLHELRKQQVEFRHLPFQGEHEIVPAALELLVQLLSRN